MALARRARKNPRRGVSMKARGYHGKGHCGKGVHGKGHCGKGVHGMGMKKKAGLMKGLGFLKSASRKLKKGLKKKNVAKLLDTVSTVADVASEFAVTEEGKARAERVKKGASKARSVATKVGAV